MNKVNEVVVISGGRQPDSPKKVKTTISKEKLEKFLPAFIAALSIAIYFVFTVFFVDSFAKHFLGFMAGVLLISVYMIISKNRSKFLKIAFVLLTFIFFTNLVLYFLVVEKKYDSSETILTPIFYDHVGSYPLKLAKNQVSEWITIGPCHKYNFSHDQIEMLPQNGRVLKVWQIKQLPNNVTTFKIINRSNLPVSLIIES